MYASLVSIGSSPRGGPLRVYIYKLQIIDHVVMLREIRSDRLGDDDHFASLCVKSASITRGRVPVRRSPILLGHPRALRRP